MRHVLAPGGNCWRIPKANRFKLLVDGSNYYGVLADAMIQAKRTIAVLGWDLDTRVQLFGEAPRPDCPPLRDFLPGLVSRNPDLHIYILLWSFPLLLAKGRQTDLVLGRNPFDHPRIHFRFDAEHAAGASHHQKIVTIDDSLAFCGGMDLAGGRWDTPEHLAHDQRRGGEEGYPPTHDAMAMVDGEAAQALAEVVRDRWQAATGKPMLPARIRADAWPADVAPDLKNVSVGLTPTNFSRGRAIEQLHLDLIASARDFLYIENQYFTSDVIADALIARLREPEGPSIVIVLPLRNSGWLEEHTIEVLRFRLIRRLRENDEFHRLRICYPKVPNLREEAVIVHSKVLIADDRILRVGSSNLTNRSMRLDTECDLTIEAANAVERRAIGQCRNRLFGEHLGLSPETVRERLAAGETPIQLVDSCAREPRGLRDLQQDKEATLLVSPSLVDPGEPLSPALLMEAFAAWLGDRPMLLLCPWAAAAFGVSFVFASIFPMRR
jgi:phospholipase D1/2